jgi:hypothetical protein
VPEPLPGAVRVPEPLPGAVRVPEFHSVGRVGVADVAGVCEHTFVMDTTRHSDPTGTGDGAGSAVATGCGCGRVEQDLANRLPVLAEVPQLGSLLSSLVRADRLVVTALDTLMGLQDSALAEQATGVGLDQWLAAMARCTGSDARMLMTATKVLRRLPALRSWLEQGRVSWAQLRAIALMVAPLPAGLDDRLDDAIGRAVLFGAPDEDPDHLVRVVRWAINEHHPQTQASDQRYADDNQFVSMQPRLDGSGGKLYGELGPQAWAIADVALNHGILPDPDHSGDRDRDGDRNRDGDGDGEGDGDGGRSCGVPRWYSAGRKRAARLTAILDHHLATLGRHPDSDPADDPIDDHTTANNAANDATTGGGEGAAETDSDPAESAPATAADDAATVADDAATVADDAATVAGDGATVAGGGGAGVGSGRAGSRPQLLVRVSLSTLLDRDQVPGELLTTLTGGRLWADAATVRRLVHERGADLRTVILDDCGAIVGVGRRRRLPPGWLADATLAIHDTCTAPGCRTAARVCDLDHAAPWHPARPGDVAGSTDVGQLAPLCARHNHRKEADGWTATQQPDGTRRWTHQRSGLTTTTLPATWRPPPQHGPIRPAHPPDRDTTHHHTRPATRDGPAS